MLWISTLQTHTHTFHNSCWKAFIHYVGDSIISSIHDLQDLDLVCLTVSAMKFFSPYLKRYLYLYINYSSHLDIRLVTFNCPQYLTTFFFLKFSNVSPKTVIRKNTSVPPKPIVAMLSQNCFKLFKTDNQYIGINWVKFTPMHMNCLVFHMDFYHLLIENLVINNTLHPF